MKKPEEILNLIIANNIEDFNSPWYENGVYDGRDFEILKAIKQAQIDSYNQALEDAAGEAEADFEPMGWLAEQNMNTPFVEGEDYEVPVIRSSILKLKKDG